MNSDPRAHELLRAIFLQIADEDGTTTATSLAFRYAAEIGPAQNRAVLRRTELAVIGDPNSGRSGRPMIDDTEALRAILAADQRGVQRAISIHNESVRIVRERGGNLLSVVRRLRGKLPNLGKKPS